jgi:pimeloyl-ACP methyl ester carboxylesterase
MLDSTLRNIDVPTLILHGDVDQIVPFADASVLSAKPVKESLPPRRLAAFRLEENDRRDDSGA